MSRMREARVDCEGVALAYTDVGSGPSVLLLHGMACDRSHMLDLAFHLSGRYRCVALDLRGHGQSDAPPTGYATDVLVDDIVRAIEALGLERPVVIGHSRGGSLALALASRRPDLVRALVLLDSGIRSSAGRAADLGPFYATLGGADHAERVAAFARERLLEPTDGEEVIHKVETVMGATPAHVFLGMAEGVLDFDSWAAAQQSTMPTLLVLSARPSFLDTASLDALPPSWQVARVVGAGHFVQLVVPDQVHAMVDRFLELLEDGTTL
jgi:pimeloyl-ACP methyl ester carboxylesterase